MSENNPQAQSNTRWWLEELNQLLIDNQLETTKYSHTFSSKLTWNLTLIILLGTCLIYLWFKLKKSKSYKEANIAPRIEPEEEKIETHVQVLPTISIYIDEIFDPTHSLLVLAKTNQNVKPPEAFLNLCKISKIILFAKVDTDEDEELIKNYLKMILPPHISEKIPNHRILFSSTHKGRISMLRQLKPTLHIETCKEVHDALLGKIPNIVITTVKSNTGDLSLENIVKDVEILRECLDDPLPSH